jgi:hypothetical protein
VVCTDQTVSELSGRVLPDKERFFNRRLILKTHVHHAQESRKSAEDLALFELIAAPQDPLRLKQHQEADTHRLAILCLAANEFASALELLLVVAD